MNRLRQLRREKGMTQDDLSKASGVSRITIARIEKTGKFATLRVVRAIAKAFGCNVEDLLDDEQEAS